MSFSCSSKKLRLTALRLDSNLGDKGLVGVLQQDSSIGRVVNDHYRLGNIFAVDLLSPIFCIESYRGLLLMILGAGFGLN